MGQSDDTTREERLEQRMYELEDLVGEAKERLRKWGMTPEKIGEIFAPVPENDLPPVPVRRPRTGR